MADIKISIITDAASLPPYDGDNFFHSNTLFEIMKGVPDAVPFMVTAADENGTEQSRMLAIVRRSCLLARHGHVFGEGVYREGADKARLFKMMAEAATKVFRHHLCFYIEISGMSEKMFGYGALRSLGYFPIRWIEIRNSLRGNTPVKSILPVRRKRIIKSAAAGVRTEEVKDKPTFKRFFRMMRHFYSSKAHRYSPSRKEIYDVGSSSNGMMYATKYKNMIIGGCVCIISEGSAYLWHMAAKRKTFSTLFPASQMIWHVMRDAHGRGLNCFHFMDVGIPFGKSQMRDFLLSFGGRPISSYRWFSCSLWGLNKLLSKFFSS